MVDEFYLTKDLGSVKTKTMALEEIALFLSTKIEADTKVILDSLLERESIMDTGLEKGIAVPHVILPVSEKNDARLAVITFASPIPNWSCVDDTLVDKALCLVVSVNWDLDSNHMNKMTQIFRLLASEEITNEIQTMRTSQDIVQTLEKKLREGGFDGSERERRNFSESGYP